MRLLLDECVDRRLAREIRGHEISTASGLEWTGISNADLVARAAGLYDVLVTVDRNRTFQQPVVDLMLAVVNFAHEPIDSPTSSRWCQVCYEFLPRFSLAK